jgi:hypothetical protein
MDWEMARPAASSLALLIRKPEDRRITEPAKLFWAFDRLFWAYNEARLVLITVGMVTSPKSCQSGQSNH